MGDPFVESLRANLEAWEQQAAVYWDSVIRSPDVLRRISRQTNRTLETYQRIARAMESAALNTAASQQGAARELYLLERIERQLAVLAARIEELESRLDGP